MAYEVWIVLSLFMTCQPFIHFTVMFGTFLCFCTYKSQEVASRREEHIIFEERHFGHDRSVSRNP